MKVTKDEYLAYLRSPEWASKRQRKLSVKSRCEACNKIVDWGGHLHHITYQRIFNETLNDLMIMCKDCHKEVHNLINSGEGLLSATAKIAKISKQSLNARIKNTVLSNSPKPGRKPKNRKSRKQPKYKPAYQNLRFVLEKTR